MLITGCITQETATPVHYSPYYLVTAAPEPTRTPFQPGAPILSATNAPFATASLAELPAITAPPLASPTPAPNPTSTIPIITTPQTALIAEETITFLLLGSDVRIGQSYRTDTLVVAIIRPGDGQVSLISIPRDLWVNIPTVGMQRINTAFQYGELYDYPGGGAKLLQDTILFNLGLEVEHYAMVDFNGFRNIVDTLGGIELPVACPYTDWRLISPDLNPEYEDNWAIYTTGPGLIPMDGDLALWYARSRQKSNDFDRGRRQQEVLRALYGQILRSDTLTRIPQLYGDLSASIQTDVGLPAVLELAPMSLHLSNADIRSYYIAGKLVTPWITPAGAYVLLPNSEAIQAMLNEAIHPSPRVIQRQAIKVEIQNGTSTDGWDVLAAERLNYAGYETSFHTADNRQHAQTLLYDLTNEQDPEEVASLLAVLGLSQSALVKLPGTIRDIPYVLIVGDDYQPCFKPGELTP